MPIPAMLVAIIIVGNVQAIKVQTFSKTYEGSSSIDVENKRLRMHCALKCQKDSLCTSFRLDQDMQCKLSYPTKINGHIPPNDDDDCRYTFKAVKNDVSYIFTFLIN